MNSTFVEHEDVHPSRKEMAVREVVSRCKGDATVTFQFGFTGWREHSIAEKAEVKFFLDPASQDEK